VDECLRLAPELLGRDVLGVPELARSSGELLGLVVAAEIAENAPEHAQTGRQLRPTAAGLQRLVARAPMVFGRTVVAGERGDHAEVTRRAGRESELARAFHRRNGQRPRLVEPFQHREQEGAKDESLRVGGFRDEGIERRERLTRRTRPDHQRNRDREHRRLQMARKTGMAQ
jgi:hypothetical protein